jgi:hypothetical protein
MQESRPTREPNLGCYTRRRRKHSLVDIGYSFEVEVLTKRRAFSRAVLPLAQIWFRLNLPLCNEESDLMAVPFGPRFG